MGHERIGVLPKSKRWRAIVGEVASASTPDKTAQIVEHTLSALDSRYRDLAKDESVQAAFSYLVELAERAGSCEATTPAEGVTPLALLAPLAERLAATRGSLETREIVRRATADVLASWYRANLSSQSDLFSSDQQLNVWRALGTGSGFCELSRLYFSRLTERYLNYFLDRESSSALPNLAAREDFQARLRAHVGDVSKLSFESAKITESYAAGWFNKYAKTSVPTVAQKRKFLSYAFDKLREEFRREGRNS